jgi:hypothetical protein
MLHCPRCGQQQVSEEIKFCSRCGMPLGIVSEVVAQGGHLAQLAQLGKKNKFFNKKNGVIFSAFWFMFFVLIMTPFWGIVGVEELAGVSAIIGIFGGLMWMIGALVLLPSSRHAIGNEVGSYASQTAQGLYGHGQQTALPPQQSQPVSSYVPAAGGWRAPDTGEFANPGSVTDNTTRLLKHDE